MVYGPKPTFSYINNPFKPEILLIFSTSSSIVSACLSRKVYLTVSCITTRNNSGKPVVLLHFPVYISGIKLSYQCQETNNVRGL